MSWPYVVVALLGDVVSSQVVVAVLAGVVSWTWAVLALLGAGVR